MFVPLPELSSDLDWMLQSGQADPAMLAEALVKEHYVQIYRLASSILNNPQAASLATKDALTAALLNVYRYRGEMGVNVWLYGITLDAIRGVQRRFLSQHNPISTGLSDPFPENRTLPTASNEQEARLWQAFDALPGQARTPLLLHWVLAWPDPDLARLLEIRESELVSLLQKSTNRLIEAFSRVGVSPPEDFETWATGSLQARWLPPVVSTPELEAVIEAVYSKAGQKGAARLRVSRLREALFMGLAIVTVVTVIWGANKLIPGSQSPASPIPTGAAEAKSAGRKALNLQSQQDPTGQALPTQTPVPEDVFYMVQAGDTLDSIAAKLGTTARALARINRIPAGQELQAGQRLFIPRFRGRPYNWVPPTPVAPQIQPDALSPDSSLTEILQRMQQVGVSFNTLWLDARFISYGPAGYVGPPQVYRAQVWYSLSQALALGGDSETQPDEVFLRTGDHLYSARPNSGSPWFSDLSASDATSSLLTTNLGLIFNAILEKPNSLPAADLKVAGKDQVAGREVLILDQTDLTGKRTARLWMDSRTGFVLRQQQFGGVDFDTLMKEVWVTGIAFDVNFPQPLFIPQMPWRGGFAGDETGQPLPVNATPLALAPAPGHEPIPAAPVPANFNPARSRLTFQFSQNFDPFDTFGIVDLFAGQYRLGSLEFGNPANMVCDRSPDGERIAFVSTPPKLG
ncbi:MAG TPA: LysM peptidoglycan-binding domain-containing protein, partial [Anaerolineales bacterium]